MNTAVLFALLGLLVFAATGGLAYGLYTFLNPTRTAQDRLRELARTESFEGFGLQDEADPAMEAIAERLGRLAAPQSEDDRNKLRMMLLQAGYKSRHAPDIFNGVRVTAALCLPMFVLPFAAGASLVSLSVMVLGAAAGGYYVPALWIRNVVEKRQRQLLASFPDCLDLLVSSVEAGLGLDAAFRRVAAEMEQAAPDLAREFQLVNHEISAGISRVEALRHLEQRTGLDEVRALVNMLAQAERFGTSVAKSLRVHAKMTRNKRIARAEEEAAKVSPKLTVVMIVFFLPVLMSILVGPAAINVFRIFMEG